jgi:hypothetical protein
MDVTSSQFEQYEAEFNLVAERAKDWEAPSRPVLDDCPMYLCLYGENGLSPEEEFSFLHTFKMMEAETYYKLEIEADYYQDTILFVPKSFVY